MCKHQGDRLDVLVKDMTLGHTQVHELLQQQELSSFNIESNSPTLENVFVTHLRQQGLATQFFPFPRAKATKQQWKVESYRLTVVVGSSELLLVLR
ncbi:MAG: hypothetical protein V7K25_04875 [Nostoc sp.]|uniref:hypothetical protein n=1 Tax=Nostoc sp. TaxID=1180 RepID=UPI002FFBBDCA